MRGRKRLFGTLVALMATIAMVCSVAGPAYADRYGYTVRVFQGNGGKLKSDPVSVTVEKGGRLNLFDLAKADVSGSKYVQIGFRLSGSDKLLGNGVVNGITEDMDYVVAYGVEGETVAYTLRFLEYGTGRELAKPQTYYGRVGDKPVAAYEYIEGYRPLYLTITGTLKENEDENVWTFEYVALQEGESFESGTTTTNTNVTNTPGNETVNNETSYEPGTTNTTTRTETVPGTTTTEPTTTTDNGVTGGTTTGTPANTQGTTTAGNATNTTAPSSTTTTATTSPSTTTSPTTTGGNAETMSPSTAGGNADTAATAGAGDAGATTNDAAGGADATAGGGNENAAAQEPAPATQEILDMDTPLAGPGSDSSTQANSGGAAQASSRVNPLAVLGVVLAAAIACGLFYFFFWKRKKDSENEPEPEE